MFKFFVTTVLNIFACVISPKLGVSHETPNLTKAKDKSGG